VALSRPPDRPTCLVLRALGLGDLLTAVPALRALKAALPSYQLVLATPPSLEPLVRLAGCVDEVLPATGLDQPLGWSGPPPELAVNLHGKGPQSHRLLAGVQPTRLVTFGTQGFEGPVWRADENEVDRWCRLVEESLALDVDRDALDLRVPAVPSLRPGAVVVHPGAAFPSRRWPSDRFVDVCRRLAEAGETVVVTGSGEEKSLVTGIVAASGLPAESDLAGRLDLEQLAALVAGARLVVCGDTGVGHLATAYRRPSVLLFGPVSPELWGPPDRPQHVVLWHGNGRGDPWGATVDPALAAIDVEEVTAAAGRLLAMDQVGGPPEDLVLKAGDHR
jgi:ADP-heptose:LPS heptosyltransferase